MTPQKLQLTGVQNEAW